MRLLVWFFALDSTVCHTSMTFPPDREIAIFGAARRLPAAERAAYLEDACAGDPALRERVEQLLQAGEEAGAFLSEPAPGAERPANPAGPDGSAPARRISTFPSEKAGDR